MCGQRFYCDGRNDDVLKHDTPPAFVIAKKFVIKQKCNDSLGTLELNS